MDLFTLTARLGMDTSEYDSKIGKARKSFSDLGSSISAKTIAMGTMMAHSLEKLVNFTVDMGKSAVQNAADVAAEKAQFTATFGELQGAAEKAFGNIEKSTGIFGTRLKNVGTKAFSQFKGAGMDGVKSLEAMEKYTNLAADAAAYYDISLEDADARLRSFLRGNTEAGDAIGLFTSESQRNSAAMEKYGQKWAKLNEEQKQMLMLDISEDIYKQSGAIGQAARESDAWTNVIGNLKEVWRQTSGVLGAPIMAVITPKIQEFTEWLKGEGVQLKLEQFALGVADKLNSFFKWVAKPTFPTWEDIKTGAADKFNSIQEGLKGAINWGLMFAGVPEDSKFYEDVNNFVDSVGKFAESGGKIAALSFENAIEFIAALAGGPDGTDDTLENISTFFTDAGGFIDKYSGPITTLIGALTAFYAIKHPFKALIAALATLIANWKDLKEWAGKALTAVQNFFKQKITDPISGALSTVGGWFETIIEKANAASEAVAKFFGIERSDYNPTQTTDEYFAPPTSGGEYDNGWGSTGYSTSGVDYTLTHGGKGASGWATGLDYVPYNDFYARLHEGEAVLTKTEANAWRNGGIQTTDYASIANAVSNAVAAALDGALVTMDRETVGELVLPTVSRGIAREAQSRRFAT